MIRAFERMTQSVLAVLGEDALFNGVSRTRINIEHDVQFDGIGGEAARYRGDMSASKPVATIDARLQPRTGQTFQMIDRGTGLPTGSVWRLDKLVDENGYSKRYIVLETP